MENVLGKIVRITLDDKRVIVGVLECVDQRGNICLRNTFECRNIPAVNESVKETHDVIKMRNTVIPCNHWTNIAIAQE